MRLIRASLKRLSAVTRRRLVPTTYHSQVMAEQHVFLSRCGFIGPVSVGYRSYSNESLFRNVSVGRFCSIGRRCTIGAALHRIDGVTTHPIGASDNFESDLATTIGNDVWVGDNAVILAGLTIGHGAIIGAGSVVTKDVPPYTIIVGIPGRQLRSRFEPALVERLLASRWWEHGDALPTLSRFLPIDQALDHFALQSSPILPPHPMPLAK